MSKILTNKIDFEIKGIASVIGEIISIEEWSERMKIPHRKKNGYLSGQRVKEILGVHGKSWAPEKFQSPDTITALGKAALKSADITPDQVDVLIIITCTPFEIKLGQDGFRFAKELGLDDNVPPIQLEAGCAGLARAIHIANNLKNKTILIITYNIVSPMTESLEEGPNKIFRKNDTHPFASILWASAGIFSDGAGAMVLKRKNMKTGYSFYSRDQIAFGGAPGFKDPIVHFPGGGVLKPPGMGNNEDLMCYAMSGPIIAEYYSQGMMLNHKHLLSIMPNYVDEVQRIYTHQAGPAMVSSFIELSGVPAAKCPTSAARFGNLVSPCTIQLLHEDVLTDKVASEDKVCFSVVGAGPERGAFILPVNVSRKVRPEDIN